MSQLKWAGLYGTWTAFCLFTLGCGGGSSVELGTVEGTVTLDGQPLANASVEFTPVVERAEREAVRPRPSAGAEGEEKEAPPLSPSYGQTDDTGHYKLMFTATAEGALPGEHIVRIKVGGDKQLPAKYNTKSELKATVKPGKNTIDFALTSK